MVVPFVLNPITIRVTRRFSGEKVLWFYKHKFSRTPVQEQWQVLEDPNLVASSNLSKTPGEEEQEASDV